MAKDWKTEVKEIITSQQSNIKKVIDDREKREAERIKKINEIKKLIKPKFEYVKELIEKDKYLLSTFETKPAEGPPAPGAGAAPPEAGLSQAAALTEDKDERTLFMETVKRGDQVKVPTINEGPGELVLIMPTLSDVNRLDLMYQIEFKDEKPILHAFDLLPAGKMKNNGSAHGNFEDFIQDTLKRFLLSWFTRKEGTELDKERKFTIVIEGHGMGMK